jgi:hypothetical protein
MAFAKKYDPSLVYPVLQELLLSYVMPKMDGLQLQDITWSNVEDGTWQVNMNRFGHMSTPLLEVHSTWSHPTKGCESVRTIFINVGYGPQERKHTCEDAEILVAVDRDDRVYEDEGPDVDLWDGGRGI